MSEKQWIGFVILDFVFSFLLSVKIADNEKEWIAGWLLLFVLSFMIVLGMDLLFY